MEANITFTILLGLCLGGILTIVGISLFFGAVGKFIGWVFDGVAAVVDEVTLVTGEIIDEISTSIKNLTEQDKEDIKSFALMSLYAASAFALYMEDDESGKSKKASEMIIDSIARDVSDETDAVDKKSSANTDTDIVDAESQALANVAPSVFEAKFSSRDDRRVRVFLSHAKEDIKYARAFKNSLLEYNYDVWLDDTDLLPGQAWDLEIQRAIRSSDVFLVCMSSSWVKRPGYIQKELNFALDEALKKPEGSIYILPTRFEDCEVPDRLRNIQYIDLFKDGHNNFQRIVKALDLVKRTQFWDN